MLSLDMSAFKQPKRLLAVKIAMFFFGEILLGFGVVFNTKSGFGNDAVTLFYEGVHKTFNINLGLAVNIINISMLVVVFIFGRKYVNIGTLIYALMLGSVVNFAMDVYPLFGLSTTVSGRVVSAVIAYVLIIVGLSFFVAAAIGVDPWNGLPMTLCDKTGRQYRFFKVIIDMAALALGLILGGRIGPSTVILALLGGPCIQKVSQMIERYIVKPIAVELSK